MSKWRRFTIPTPYLNSISNPFFPSYSSRPNQRTFFEVVATVDIRSDESIPLSELDTIIQRALESGQIGGIRVKRDHTYSLLPIEGNFNIEYRLHFYAQLNRMKKIDLPDK